MRVILAAQKLLLNYLRMEVKPGLNLLMPDWKVYLVIRILQGIDLKTDGNKYLVAT
jgi:hypothetical protein